MSRVLRRRRSRVQKPEQEWMRVGECVWCDWVMFSVGPAPITADLKNHVLTECKNHPMRRLERKLKRLEGKRRKHRKRSAPED